MYVFGNFFVLSPLSLSIHLAKKFVQTSQLKSKSSNECNNNTSFESNKLEKEVFRHHQIVQI